MRILAISGSLRADSYNTALANAARELAPAGVEVEVYEGLGLIPHYDQDLDQEDVEEPEAVAALRRRIAEADALLLVTPEYNGSLPGVLKNAIDWASARHRGSWLRNKTVAVAGATTGQYGAIWAQQDLKRVLGIAGHGWWATSSRSRPRATSSTARADSWTRCSPRGCVATSPCSPSTRLRSAWPRETPRGRADAAPRTRLPALDLVEALSRSS